MPHLFEDFGAGLEVANCGAVDVDDAKEDFAHLIETWENVFVNQMMTKRGDGPEAKAKMRQGLQDQIAAARHPKGYAGWPIWAASGRKP